MAHALALPAGLALRRGAWQLARRRRRALIGRRRAAGHASGASNLLKGLDVEEAAASWALAAVLAWPARAFTVRPRTDLAALVRTLAQAPALGAAALACSAPCAGRRRRR